MTQKTDIVKEYISELTDKFYNHAPWIEIYSDYYCQDFTEEQIKEIYAQYSEQINLTFILHREHRTQSQIIWEYIFLRVMNYED